MVPIKGEEADTLHLIDEDLAIDYLPKGKIKRFRLVLATKPFDVFFLLNCPTAKSGQWLERHGAGRLRTGEDDVDASYRAARRKASTATRSIRRAIRSAFPDPTLADNSRSMS